MRTLPWLLSLWWLSLAASSRAQAPETPALPAPAPEAAAAPPPALNPEQPAAAPSTSAPEGAAVPPGPDQTPAAAPPEVAPGYPTTGYPVPRAPGGPVLPTRVDARLRMLSTDLDILAARSDGRVLDGSLQIAAGSAFVVIGVFVDDALFRSLLMLTGSLGVAKGINELALLPNAEKPASTFAAMPMTSADDVRARVRYGEEALFALARATRRARIVDGCLTMFGSAAYVPLYWLMRRDDEPRYRFGDDPVDYVGLAVSTVAFASGLLTAVIKSDAERRAARYRETRDRFEREAPGELERLSLRPRMGVALSKQTASVSARWRF